jgi:DNA polymerase elongation subunit (family B)
VSYLCFAGTITTSARLLKIPEDMLIATIRIDRRATAYRRQRIHRNTKRKANKNIFFRGIERAAAALIRYWVKRRSAASRVR